MWNNKEKNVFYSGFAEDISTFFILMLLKQLCFLQKVVYPFIVTEQKYYHRKLTYEKEPTTKFID